MANKFVRFFQDKKNRQALIVSSLILAFLTLLRPDVVIPLTTQSLFGFFGVTLSISVAVFLVGVFLILVPEPATTLLGIVLAAIAIFTGAFSFIESLNALVPRLGTIFLWAIGGYAAWTFLQKQKK